MSPPYRDIESYGVDLDKDQITKEEDEEIMRRKERQVKEFISYSNSLCQVMKSLERAGGLFRNNYF